MLDFKRFNQQYKGVRSNLTGRLERQDDTYRVERDISIDSISSLHSSYYSSASSREVSPIDSERDERNNQAGWEKIRPLAPQKSVKLIQGMHLQHIRIHS
ncbi:uncharacterized protein I206_100525 [Kwoniella pini CBS 10737]|uniref:Uncharacterized protein n=1 Tax=Kwoniella pini CBS 10737 TaxID=1296096 RepID=A0A1B9IDE6_9TREE|nr:uncharacterized protein I206_00802 [Kwoniella pini CBS 10737]OCF53497.1 hypothetical protein I206_00802 [Kwoniella pini CBS 10737]